MTQNPGWSSPSGPGEPAPPPASPGPPPPTEPSPYGGWGPPPGGPGTPWARSAKPRDGIVPLRPLSIGEIYDGAFQAIRTNPRTMVGIAAIVMAVTTLIGLVPQAAAITALGGSSFADPETAETMTRDEVVSVFAGTFSATLLPAIVQIIALFVVTGLLIVAVSEAVIGRKTTAGALWARTRGRLLRLVGLLLLEILALLVLFALLLAPGLLVLFVSVVGGIALMVAGGLIGFVVSIAFYFSYWSLAAPALLLEDLGILAALRRSRQLAGRSFWRVLGITVLSAILVGIGSGLVSLPFGAGSAVITYLDGDEPSFLVTLAALAVGGIGSIIGAAIFYPFSAAVTALLYVDLRMRQEGLDVELARAGGVA